MGAFLKVIIAGAILLVMLTALTVTSARAKERKIHSVKPGMHKAQVEALLGVGQPDISSDGVDHKWPPEREQFSYKGNPSLWYGRWEDELVVGYTNNTVFDTRRCGL